MPLILPSDKRDTGPEQRIEGVLLPAIRVKIERKETREADVASFDSREAQRGESPAEVVLRQQSPCRSRHARCSDGDWQNRA